MSYPIDIESETLQFDGEWYTRDELARHIKKLLDANDYNIGRPAAALEHLTQTLANLRTLALRVLPEMHEKLTHEAARQGRPVGALVRDAISAYLGMSAADMGPLRSAYALPPAGRRPTDPEIAVPGIADTQLMDMPLIDDVNGTPDVQQPVHGAGGAQRSVIVDFKKTDHPVAPTTRGD